MLYPCKSGWNLPNSSWDMVHTSTFCLKFGSLSPTVTMKMISRSPKPNKLFIKSQCYIHANLVKIHLPVHAKSCKQESVTLTQTPTPTESAPKTIPFGGGHNDQVCECTGWTHMTETGFVEAWLILSLTMPIMLHVMKWTVGSKALDNYWTSHRSWKVKYSQKLQVISSIASIHKGENLSVTKNQHCSDMDISKHFQCYWLKRQKSVWSKN